MELTIPPTGLGFTAPSYTSTCWRNSLYLANKANNPDDKTELLKKRIRKENKVGSSADKSCALTEENPVAGFDFERYAASIFSVI